MAFLLPGVRSSVFFVFFIQVQKIHLIHKITFHESKKNQ